MSQKKSKRLYRVSGVDEYGNTRTFTFQTRHRAVACAERWAKGHAGYSYTYQEDEVSFAPLKDVRVDVSEPVFFPSDFGISQTLPLDLPEPKAVVWKYE